MGWFAKKTTYVDDGQHEDLKKMYQQRAQTAVASGDPYGYLKGAAGGEKPPPDSPDVTDQLVRQKQAAAASQLMLGRGRAQSFSQGDMGDLNIGQKKLLGGGQ